METSERAARLDDRAARGVRRRDRRPPASPTRTRRLAAGSLIAVLAVAALAASRGGSASSASAPVTAPTAETATAPVDPAPLRALFAGNPGCADHGVDVPEVSCTIDDVRVDARLVGPVDAERLFGGSATPHTGPPACAAGNADERTWARPAAPDVAAGRYRCRLEEGRAVMWWTDEAGIIAHAVAPGADLARLFVWWRTHLDGR